MIAKCASLAWSLPKFCNHFEMRCARSCLPLHWLSKAVCMSAEHVSTNGRCTERLSRSAELLCCAEPAAKPTIPAVLPVWLRSVCFMVCGYQHRLGYKFWKHFLPIQDSWQGKHLSVACNNSLNSRVSFSVFPGCFSHLAQASAAKFALRLLF